MPTSSTSSLNVGERDTSSLLPTCFIYNHCSECLPLSFVIQIQKQNHRIVLKRRTKCGTWTPEQAAPWHCFFRSSLVWRLLASFHALIERHLKIRLCLKFGLLCMFRFDSSINSRVNYFRITNTNSTLSFCPPFLAHQWANQVNECPKFGLRTFRVCKQSIRIVAERQNHRLHMSHATLYESIAMISRKQFHQRHTPHDRSPNLTLQ